MSRIKSVLSLVLCVLVVVTSLTVSWANPQLKVYGVPYTGTYDVWNSEHNSKLENDIPGNPGFWKPLPEETLADRRARVFQLLVGAGYTKEAAAGIVGNLWEESGGGYTALLEFAYASSWMRNGQNKCWETALQDWTNGMTYGFGMFGFTSSGPMFAVFDAAAEMNMSCFDVDPQVKGVITQLEQLENDGVFGDYVKQLKTNKYNLNTEDYIKACSVTMTCAYERNWAYGQLWPAESLKIAMRTGNVAGIGSSKAAESFQFRAKKALEEYENFKDLPGITFGGATVKDKTSSGTKGGMNIKEEWEIVGFKNPMEGSAVQLDQMGREYLSTTETYQIVNIGDNMELQNSLNLWDTARTFLVFIGMLLLVYSTLLGLAMAADNVRIFAQFSVVELVSLGSIHYAGSDKDYLEEKTHRKYKSNKGMIAIIAIIFLFGLLLVSGAVLPAVMKVVAKVTGLFGAV